MKKEISPLLLLVASVILLVALTVFGLFHLIAKSFYHTFQLKFWKGPLYFMKYWLKVLYQLWNVFKFFCMQIAISIDLFGNVTTGEAIEDFVTYKEETMYGNGNVTISTATGQLEYEKELNKTGINFSKVLSVILDKDHCVASYKRFLHNQTFKLE